MTFSENEVEAYRQKAVQLRRGTKAFWEATNDWHYAQLVNAREALTALHELVADSSTGKLIAEIESLRKDVASLKDELQVAGENWQQEAVKAQAREAQAQEELDALKRAIGLSAMDYDIAQARGQLPTGEWLI